LRPSSGDASVSKMKRRINLCTALRQGSSYARAFFHQTKALMEKGYELGAIAVVVDGETLTDKTLIDAQADPRVRFVFEGPHASPTCFIHERAVSWARAANLALEHSLATTSDYTLWVESDLSFPCDLIELLIEADQDIVAPIVMLGEIFYDSWGFRDLQGRRIWKLADLQALPRGPGPLTELSSVGSCLLIRSSLLVQGLRMPASYENGLLVGFCLAARERGARVFCRHDAVVVHPTSLWAEQVYRVTTCRRGDNIAWEELAPSGGGIVPGPYFDFIIPEAIRLLAAIEGLKEKATHISFATNPRREIAILLGDGKALPPPPDGFQAIAPQQAFSEPLTPRPKRGSFWANLFSR